MAEVAVYVEVGPDGAGLAHVPALPGCLTRGPDVAAALAALPAAIHAYYAWLRRHGEDAPDPPAPLTLTVQETRTGGPFAHGDPAALFTPDEAPISQDEMAAYFRRAGYSRADLLDLVRGLPAALRDWRAGPGTMSIREILRHIGNAEEWYVSRLVEPATLPPVWEHDEALPLTRFLAMERRTVLARLRGLTDAERAAVRVPTAWAHTPGEPWTARKALRRLLEHEREHTAHIAEVLEAWRRLLRARMATERAGLFAALLGLDAATLTTRPVVEQWTAKDLLAHVAAWDELFTERSALILDGWAAQMVSVDLEARNAALTLERCDWSLAQAVAVCEQARTVYLSTLARVPDADLHRLWPLPVGRRSLRTWAQWRYRHDAGHARQIARWRKAGAVPSGVGPQPVLLAALRASRAELLATIALVPEAARATRPLCGDWTLADVLRHVTAWEAFVAARLGQLAAGALAPPPMPDASWNERHVTARRGEPWTAAWAEFLEARVALLAALDPLSEDDLARPLPGAGDPQRHAYDWAVICIAHEREHAADVRAGLGLPAGILAG